MKGRPRRNDVYVPGDGYSPIRVAVRAVDLDLHAANLRAIKAGKAAPNKVRYRTLGTIGGRQVERYSGCDFAKACVVADHWHDHLKPALPGPLTSTSTFGDVLATCLTTEARPNCGRKQMDRLGGFARNHLAVFAKRRCSTLTAAQFNEVFIGLVGEGYAADTIQGIVDFAKSAVRYGARNGAQFGGVDIATDMVFPRKLITLRDKTQPLKPGEVRPLDVSKLPTGVQVDGLIDAAGAVAGALGSDLITFIDDGGFRWGEAIGARPAQWDPVRCGFTVDRQLNEYDSGWEFTLPKYDKTRFVPVSPALVPMIEARITQALEDQHATFASGKSKNPHGLLFYGPKGGWLRRSNFHKRILTPAAELTRKRAADAGNLDAGWPEHLTMHSLRHRAVMRTYRDLVAAYGGDAGSALLDTSRLFGHHDPGYTARKYLSADDDYVERVRRAKQRG